MCGTLPKATTSVKNLPVRKKSCKSFKGLKSHRQALSRIRINKSSRSVLMLNVDVDLGPATASSPRTPASGAIVGAGVVCGYQILNFKFRFSNLDQLRPIGLIFPHNYHGSIDFNSINISCIGIGNKDDIELHDLQRS